MHLKLRTRTPQNGIDVFVSLRTAVTEWAKEVDLGRALCAYASGGLTVGDLLVSDAFEDSELRARMEARGIRFHDAREVDVPDSKLTKASINYHAALTDPIVAV